MTAQIADLASARPGARIRISPTAQGWEVRLEPRADRPGVCDGDVSTFAEARRHALAMRILTGRAIVVDYDPAAPAQDRATAK